MSEKRREATYQDVLDAPEHMIAELIDGELFLSPRPGAPHATVASMLGGELIPPFCHGRGGPGGWIILFEPELHLGKPRRVVVPDFAGWRTSRMPVVPEEAHITLPPDWVCEVASKRTEKLDRGKKMRVYAKAGVGHLWLINHRIRMLEILRLHEAKWLQVGVHCDDEKVRAEPFDAFELDLTRLWWALPLRASEADELEEAYW